MEEQVKVVVNHITPQTVEFFDPQDNSLGFVNEYTFGDVKVQIAENRLSGYYVKFQDRKLKIDHFGTLEDYPNGFFDTNFNHNMKLFSMIRKNKIQTTI